MRLTARTDHGGAHSTIAGRRAKLKWLVRLVFVAAFTAWALGVMLVVTGDAERGPYDPVAETGVTRAEAILLRMHPPSRYERFELHRREAA